MFCGMSIPHFDGVYLMEKTVDNLTYCEQTGSIRVTVLPEFLPQQSDPNENVYTFAYSILIENIGDEVVQLLSRHWLISSGGTHLMEVKGEGVVGEQPLLKSFEAFQYTSGVVIKHPVGSMHGTYTFQVPSGELFEVVIPKFDLMYPSLLH